MKKYSLLLILEMIVLSVQCQGIGYRECMVVVSFYEQSKVESRLLQRKVYNDRDQVITEVEYNEDAKESGRTNFYYNDTLLILQDAISDEVRRRKIYLYNNKGIINEIITEENGRILSIEDYSYEDRKLLEKNFTEYNDGVLLNVTSEIYHYDHFGRLIETSVVNDGDSTVTIQFKYNPEGKISKEINFMRGILEGENLFRYNDNGDLIQEIYFHNGTLTDSVNYYYDSRSNHTKTTYFSGGRLYSKVEKEYGGNGFVSKIIKTDYPKPLGRVIEDPASKQSEEDPPNEVLEEKTITYYTNKEVALEEHFENERLISKVEYKYSTLKPKE